MEGNNQLTITNKPKYSILRWIGFIPIFFIAKLIIYVIGSWMWYTGSTYLGDSWFPNMEAIIGTVVVTGLSTYAALSLAIKCAPDYKKNSALAILVIVAVLMGIGLFVNWVSLSGVALISKIAECLISIIVCCYGYLQTTDEGLELD